MKTVKGIFLIVFAPLVLVCGIIVIIYIVTLESLLNEKKVDKIKQKIQKATPEVIWDNN